ncbi:MAG TPA: putative lipid II flippase FtsW, partial [Actinomycetes bacterium]|nr:putative lipid II flippase FtsW [Actinomycetes bacterium]
MTSIPMTGGVVAAHPRLLERPLTSYYLVLGCTAMLSILGLVMVWSASFVWSWEKTGSAFTVLQKQSLYAAIGIVLLIAGAKLPLRWWRRLAYPSLLVIVVLLALVPVIGRDFNGNKNWISIGGGFLLQPSEFAKLALVVWGADLLARKRKVLGQWKHLLVPLVPVAGLIIALVLAGHDLGTAMILGAILVALLFYAGAPVRLFIGLALVAAPVVVWLISLRETRIARVTGFLTPEADPLAGGYQALNSIYALGTGGWLGVGLGGSRQKWGSLPEAHTDFIFAVVGEELGLMGTLAVVALLALLGYAGIRIALRSRDIFARLAAAGVTAWLMFQAFVNLGAVLGLLPITGVPL